MSASSSAIRAASAVLSVLAVSSCAHASTDGFGGGGAGGELAATSTNGSTGSATVGPGSSGATTSSTSSSNVASSATSTGSGMSGPGTLFFSEYVEGSSNNKALEITNGGPTSMSLTGCVIDHYQNGSSTAGTSTVLDGVTLPAGGVYVICHTSFTMTSLCDKLDGTIQHTGNDATVLTCNGTTLDSIGRVGEDMVWGTAPTITQDATLRRKCSVTMADTNPTDPYDPAAQWDGFPVDTFGDLGQYVCP